MQNKFIKFTEKQIHILEVAEKLIAKKGFKGTSVRDISSTANINVAMISYYFGSKEKMMLYLYQYRIRKVKESFVTFAETIKDGKPEMQMKEMIKFVISQIFKHSYFYGFVIQELNHTDDLKKELADFYNSFILKFDDVIKKGVTSGIFIHAPKPEELISIIIGSSLFVIKNQNFYQIYVPRSKDHYLKEAEKKVYTNLVVTIFSVLGYNPNA